MANPFRFGQIVSGELFCNRKSEISQITDNLAGGQSIILYSLRRYGKTSLLYAASNELRSRKILVGYVDFFACNSTEKILLAVSRASAKAIVDEMKSIEKFIKRAAHFGCVWHRIVEMILNPRRHPLNTENPTFDSFECCAI